VTQDDKLLMVVRNGEIQRKNVADGSISFIRFDTYSLDAATFSAPARAGLRAKERPTGYLLDPPTDDPAYQSSPASFRQEFHRRLSEPLYPLAMVFIGLFFTVNARSNRQEAGLALFQAATLCFLLRAAGFVVVNDAGTSSLMAGLSYALPGGAALIFAALLWRGKSARINTRYLDAALAAGARLVARFKPAQAAQ
jgi:lipopolysaccharide export system permease protein